MTLKICVLLVCFVPALCAGNTTIAVLNFANTQPGSKGDPNNWLSKAMADLLISDLTSSSRLRVVTREDMQILMKEADLIDKMIGRNSLQDDATRKLQQFLKVDWLVFGTYTVSKGALLIRAQVIDYKSGSILSQFELEGDVATALELEKTLAERLLTYAEGGKEGSVKRVLPRWTDSVPASQHLYQGVDLFDHSDYTAAFYEFQQALSIDPGYADARYWLARMYYYRQEYEHARLEYARFVHEYPKHGRVGDATMEFVHSYECLSNDPAELIKLYRTLRTRDWQGVRVHNQVDYVSSSPLKDWILKREQQALVFQKKYGEAFALMDQEMSEKDVDIPANLDKRWRDESAQLMSGLAELSEDTCDKRLVSPNLPYRDIELATNNPVIHKDIRNQGLKGVGYMWGTNYRILAPRGFYMKKFKVRIERTNDPKFNSICRLQIRRYRYVDINTCWTENNMPATSNYVFDVILPPGCTWVYLRPEYDSGVNMQQRVVPPCSASFDGFSVEAELVPLGEVGRLDLLINNAASHKVSVDGVYARSYNGVIPNLRPGHCKLRVESLAGGQPGFELPVMDVDVPTGQTQRVSFPLLLGERARTNGWENPVCIAGEYPVFKLRPQRSQNWANGRPTTWIDPETGRRVVIWSHLDDLWMVTSEDGVRWGKPVNLLPPVNSAHIEIRPRLIRDEEGRFCLTFLSDRGIQRGLASYACWSRDLQKWSRPALISSDYLDDQDLIQTRNGQYIFISTKALGGNRRGIGVWFQRSSDLVRWSDPNPLGVLATPNGICLRQDNYDNFHLFWAGQDLEHWVAKEMDKFGNSESIPRRAAFKGMTAATVAGDRMVAVVGGMDGAYTGQESFDIVWSGPETTNRWQFLDPPSGVVDSMCDVIYDKKNDQLVLTWQTTSMGLNSVFPSGPVYCMNVRPEVWKIPASMPGGSIELNGKGSRK